MRQVGPAEEAVGPEYLSQVAAVLDLGDGIEAGEVHPSAFLFGELRSQDERPVVELLANDSGAQLIGGGLQGRQVIDREEGIVILLETDSGALDSEVLEPYYASSSSASVQFNFSGSKT